MKKLLLAVAIAVGGATVVADLPIQNVEAQAKPTKVIVELDSKNSRLNVRKGPGTQYSVVGKLKNGTVLTSQKSIYNKKEKRYYSLIKYKGKKAYVCNDYLLPTGPGAAG